MVRHRNRRTPREGSRISGLVIQLLTTEWTKESRGGPGAQPRNTTPLAMALPDSWAGMEDSGFRLHHVYFSEQRRFQPREWTEVRGGKAFVEVEAFRIERTPEGVRVLLDHGRMGMPGALEWSGMSRSEPPEELLRLEPGQWGRGIYDERLPYWETGHWGYCKHVLNVGLLHEAGVDVFLHTEPRAEAVREFLSRQREPATPGGPSARSPTAPV
jgi:hypothetical protein